MSMERKDSGKRIDNGRSAMKGLRFQNKGTYVFQTKPFRVNDRLEVQACSKVLNCF